MLQDVRHTDRVYQVTGSGGCAQWGRRSTRSTVGSTEGPRTSRGTLCDPHEPLRLPGSLVMSRSPPSASPGRLPPPSLGSLPQSLNACRVDTELCDLLVERGRMEAYEPVSPPCVCQAWARCQPECFASSPREQPHAGPSCATPSLLGAGKLSEQAPIHETLKWCATAPQLHCHACCLLLHQLQHA